MPAFAGRTRVQKHKRVAKPLMVELSMMMIDELGDSPARASYVPSRAMRSPALIDLCGGTTGSSMQGGDSAGWRL